MLKLILRLKGVLTLSCNFLKKGIPILVYRSWEKKFKEIVQCTAYLYALTSDTLRKSFYILELYLVSFIF